MPTGKDRHVWVGVRMPKELKYALQEAAKKSGWSLSDKLRYEIAERRGMYHPPRPYLPQPVPPGKH